MYPPFASEKREPYGPSESSCVSSPMESRSDSPSFPNGVHQTERVSSSKILQGIAILEALEHDSRPTFVVQTEFDHPQGHKVSVPAYWNPAMTMASCESPLTALLDTTVADTSTTTEFRRDLQGFRDWVSESDSSEYFLFAGFTWVKTEVVERNVVIVSGIPSHASTNPPSRKSLKARTQTFDWTDAVPPSNLSPHIAWARSIDWAHTSLGPMSVWSPQLRSFANLVLSDPRP